MDEFFGTFFGSTVVSQQLAYLEASLLKDIWETFYSTVLSTFFAYVIGLPLGIILVTGEPDGVRPLPRALMRVINVIVNLLRSVPFLILMVLVIPLSRVIIGTSVGTVASIIPLVVAAFPFVARLVEASLRESDHGILEAAQAMGCTPMQITFKVMLPEALPSLINGFTTAFITILGYGAMSAAIGGGGLGSLAINNGYQRRMYTGAVCVRHPAGHHGADLPVPGHPHRQPARSPQHQDPGNGASVAPVRQKPATKPDFCKEWTRFAPLPTLFSGQKLPLTPVAFCGKFNANESKIMHSKAMKRRVRAEVRYREPEPLETGTERHAEHGLGAARLRVKP